MNSIMSMVAVVTVIIMIAFTRTSAQEIENPTWSQSYESYRSEIKPLPKEKKVECEQRLKEILNDLDTKNRCTSDEVCTLLNQDPFGNTVPILKEHAKVTKSRMKEYNEACVDPSKHFMPNKELVHVPVCWKNKCMVKTSLKK